MEREEISAGNQGKVKRTGIVFFIYGAYGDWCIYPCACTALPVHAAAFIHDPFRAHFREQERSGLRGSLCSSWSVGGSRFYAGRRAGIYFPAYFRLSFGVHRGSLAYGGNCRSIWKNCHLSAFYLRTWQDFLWSTFLEWFMYTS